MRGTWAISGRHAILLFGLLNAALFSALLPLWEGFDEAFHYGYVESLWQTRQLPVLAVTRLPRDVAESLRLAPVSHVVARTLPESAPYDVWFALPPAERERRRGALEGLTLLAGSDARTNYEAHQPPLAYLLLAPLDAALSRFPITARVSVLRLCCGVGAVVLLFLGTGALCRVLEVPERFETAALLAIFCSEMFYASAAHVANDWLAIGIAAFLLAALAEMVRAPDRRTALRVGAWLAAGLLTKAYFLIFAAVVAGVWATLLVRRSLRMSAVLPPALLVLALGGPWYARNMALYGNVSGTQEAYDGIGLRQAVAAARHIDWWSTSGYLARASLWTGNNSFGSFSRATLNVMLALLAIGVAAWCVQRRRVRPAEWMVGIASVVFSVGVAYACCTNFAEHGADAAGASPWYTQVLLAPVVVLAYLGLSRWPRVGAALAAVSVLLWTWVLIATWMLKLFPLYSGGGTAPMRARDVWAWYTHGAHAAELSLTALAPAAWLYAGMVVSIVMAVGLAVVRIRELARAS
jgi:hypothetical protein